MRKINVGIIGCGVISEIYLKNLTECFSNVTVCALSDLNVESANKRAIQFNIPKICTPDELYNDSKIELIVNLTTPKYHADICIKTLDAGKHIYVEKTLAINMQDADAILQKAKTKNLLVGCAPDTFLGAGIQTCRQIIAEGKIGTPTIVSGFMVSGGPESWHPNPEFLYKNGAGPLFDMAPYYLTAMVELFGNIKAVTSFANISFKERKITSQPLNGQIINVEVPTNIVSALEFDNNLLGNLVVSFDANSYTPRMEVFGTKGSLIVPDPNYFDGPVLIKTVEDNTWQEVPLVNEYSYNARGLGISNMADAILSEKVHRASGARAHHVLQVMHNIYNSSYERKHMEILTDMY